MRKTPTLLVGLLATGAIAGTAVAQAPAGTHTLQMSVKPSKAGKKSSPRAVTKLKLSIANDPDSKTTASRIEVSLPKTLKLNLRDFKRCSVDRLENDGEDTCPKGSQVGTGKASALANANDTKPIDEQFKVDFNTEFFVSSSKSLGIVLDSTNIELRKILVARIGKATGKYGQKLTIDIPTDVQKTAAGFSALTSITTSLSGKAGKGRRRHGLIESVGCSGGLYDFQSKLTYAPNPNPPVASTSTATDSVDCKK